MIESRRFILRDFTAADEAAFRAYWGAAGPGAAETDPAVDADGLVDRFRDWAREEPRTNRQLAVVRRRDGAYVGCAGLRGAGWPPRVAELGLEIVPAFRGRYGYAVEIAAALLAFGFGPLGLRDVVGVTTPGNRAANRLAAWFGGVPNPSSGDGRAIWRIGAEGLSGRTGTGRPPLTRGR
ncbi:GNAT family N-acetyltransferase [Prosthecomicrobium sp. N25]|uniref:GNAT family N-acetyltransferase n=1 Tax=Prosthecomicrobium sp. N25 TaxID=3129254 RepID=UPI0030776E0C